MINELSKTIVRSSAIMSLVVLALSSCADYQEQAALQANAAGWHWKVYPSRSFDIQTAQSGRQSRVLRVYIEGDGMAYLSPSRPSSDPTPHHALGLELALADASGDAVAYLARPCQYTMAIDRACGDAYWTNLRFSPEVIAGEESVLEDLKKEAGASKLILYGYSGGAAIAILIASRRDDVVELVTIAGNLDTDAWSALGGTSPLKGSLNPADVAEKVASIPQLHFVGSEDTVVPRSVAESFVAKSFAAKSSKIVIIPEFDHDCCWVAAWDRLQRWQPENSAP